MRDVIYIMNNKKDKRWIHDRYLLHMSSHLLVVNDNKEILCRLRSRIEERYKDLWTTTFGTHVIGLDGYLDTIMKNYPVDDIRWIGEFRVNDGIENEINGLFVSDYLSNRRDLDLTDRLFLNLDSIRREEMTPHLFEAYRLFKEVG